MARILQLTYIEKPQFNINKLLKRNHGYLIFSRSCKGYPCRSDLPLYGGTHSPFKVAMTMSPEHFSRGTFLECGEKNFKKGQNLYIFEGWD